MSEREDEFATDVAQSILISHLDMIVEVLNFLGVPHEDGFFPKDAEVAQYLTEGWQERAWQEFSGRHPKPALLFYINHLAWEVSKAEQVYLPAA
ncbi:MAG: hypothetical protein JNL62_22080 [Bryobacterales bacterium]|nr:hypothetical protein [Bryobacterales bacterium]